jgi:hypothetical protein
VNDSQRDGRLKLGGISLVLGILGGLATGGGFVATWFGLAGSYSETNSAALTGACVATIALAISVAALVVGVIAFRRPTLASTGTWVAIAGVVTASLSALLALGLIGFAYLALVINSAAVM